MLFEAIR